MIHIISDLHLCEERPDLTALFNQYMDEIAPKSDALYVLGDLFESWIGDDDDSEFVKSIIAKFKDYSETGKPLYFQHGNRDFLLGDEFAKATGGVIVGEVHPITIGNKEAILMHGDSLCWDDKEYMQFRQMVRSDEWQQQLLSQPLAVRRGIAADLRQKSREAQANKASAITDVHPDAVKEVLQKHQADILIHGHTHRPDFHDIEVNGKHCQRIVLSDWGDKGHFLTIEGDEIDSHYFA
ncbi:UDP-2,3-diacylglucosamine diphosphatase [Kangiella aquimarina]|uniref:UDP-2,3-diacylglucosamine hydrolase n=1 Tax=Kangiella aquimarina TaxID=261965 RepID=A0ABZ0X6L8_9GAMM|nr:UDP-2,3-diacylglucosamine diphosphatase [Kangiella aquimarina]WQG86255.1 UDP-2,3-diacylglucosamine diphosphatase [Kangiella aquimarina]